MPRQMLILIWLEQFKKMKVFNNSLSLTVDTSAYLRVVNKLFN